MKCTVTSEQCANRYCTPAFIDLQENEWHALFVKSEIQERNHSTAMSLQGHTCMYRPPERWLACSLSRNHICNVPSLLGSAFHHRTSAHLYTSVPKRNHPACPLRPSPTRNISESRTSYGEKLYLRVRSLSAKVSKNSPHKFTASPVNLRGGLCHPFERQIKHPKHGSSPRASPWKIMSVTSSGNLYVPSSHRHMKQNQANALWSKQCWPSSFSH